MLSAPAQGEVGGRGVRSLPFCPPSPDAISVRIFSNRHRLKESWFRPAFSVQVDVGQMVFHSCFYLIFKVK
ncbi:MAG: hypothetical protein COY04_00285 [Parcubacteria group bacterium CG_4_10_14_0_2_um_filter_7_35_8]|nr:MAG: hypothetical protein COY04_00285 [Parcubacteria group bacterium CG_4_10_14_0_2_um_filter_7_35_8]